jgi:hypothetical protein
MPVRFCPRLEGLLLRDCAFEADSDRCPSYSVHSQHPQRFNELVERIVTEGRDLAGPARKPRPDSLFLYPREKQAAGSYVRLHHSTGSSPAHEQQLICGGVLCCSTQNPFPI